MSISDKWFEEYRKVHEALIALAAEHINANDTIAALRADVVLQDKLIESLEDRINDLQKVI